MQSFYQFLMTFRHGKPSDEMVVFAEHVFRDPAFPKLCNDYAELSEYLETHVDYILDMSLFDEVWQIFLEKNGKVLD